MNLDLDKLARNMEELLNDIIIEEKICTLGNLKEELVVKSVVLNGFLNKFKKKNSGKFTNVLINDLTQVKEEFNQLHENFDDKLMIFIIGNGNVGKSTLLNSLIGYEVAETNFLPNTWKIDVYSPGNKDKKGMVKYSGGKHEKLCVKEIKRIVDNEEFKSKEGKKKYNENLNRELKSLKTKEERDEMKKYLGEKFLYKSNISEVRWPVDKNWLLEKCLLVDTPGLNQNLHDLEQLGNIHNYYHKADGVLWLLDGQTIAAANSNSLFEELDDVLKTVGGVRNNIIGVINRMDLVKKNGGQGAVDRVLNDAKRIFGKKFNNIVDMSAQQALQGVKANNSSIIKESGILNLQNAIRDIFISKSDTIKNSAKIQGSNRLLDITFNKLKDYNKEIDKYEQIYIEKNEKLKSLNLKLKQDFEEEIDDLVNAYLSEVSNRVDIHINALGDGKGRSFVENTIYKLSDFNNSINKFIKSKELEIKNKAYTWQKLCEISEYKYITTNSDTKGSIVTLSKEFNLNTLNTIAYFKPLDGGDIFSLIGNLFGKIGFFFRKGSIKNQLNNTIIDQCNERKEEILLQLNNNIDSVAASCEEIIEKSFEGILFNFEEVEGVREEIKNVEDKLREQKESISLMKIIL